MTAPAMTLGIPAEPGRPVTGMCWLWCGGTTVPVWWAGHVRIGAAAAGLWACQGCLQHLTRMVRAADDAAERARRLTT